MIRTTPLRKHRVLGVRALEDHLLVAEPLQCHVARDLFPDVSWRVNELFPATDQRPQVLDVRHRAYAYEAGMTVFEVFASRRSSGTAGMIYPG